MPDIKYVIETLKSYDWYKGQIERVEILPARQAKTAELNPPLPGPLQDYLKSQGIQRLYSHQVEAINKIREKKNVVMTTATASGKTLAFNLPIFERLAGSTKATALYLYPLKALTNDQRLVLDDMVKATGLKLNPAVYDGDTPQDKRAAIRKKSRIVLSNPYEIHHFLPYHYKWNRFFENLAFIVIDEAHWYRGILGSNIAYLIRRLLRICHYYGSDPSFILASASIANAKEFTQKITTKPCEIISRDGSPQGKKHIVFWNTARNPKRSPPIQSKDLFAHFVNSGLQTLCFIISRRLSELIVHWAKNEHPDMKVTPYRAGYLPDERRQLEKGLRDRAIHGIVSTEALELGIDIGGLDCVQICRYPGTIASFWQQAGRAGRKTQDTLVAYLGFENLLDQYLLKHPEVLLAANFEHAVVDLNNPYIMNGHLRCAAAELPVKLEEQDPYWNPSLGQELKNLKQEFQLRDTPNGWVYSGKERPQEVVSLNNISAKSMKAICDNQLLETLDRGQAFKEAHLGAVLLHQGETYVVEKFDLENETAEVVRKDVDYLTQPVSNHEVKVLEEMNRKAFRGFKLLLGRIQVTSHYTGYKVKKFGQVISFNPLDLPPLHFHTISLWFTLGPGIKEKCDERGLNFAGGLHGMEHALTAMAPLRAMCDVRDIGGVMYPVYPPTKEPTVFVYDGYEGGIGVAEKLYTMFDDLGETVYSLIKDCDCEDGCLACILSSSCGDNNTCMDKRASLLILKEMLGGMKS